MSVLDGLNTAPTYIFKIPSTGKEVKFRPFLVKEEKELMIAKGSDDPKNYIEAVKKLISSCTFGKVDPDSLASFDIESFFILLRAKSVGEDVEVTFRCKNIIADNEAPCNYKIEVVIPLNDVTVKEEDIPKDMNIKLNDTVSIEMKFPSFDTLALLTLAKADEDVVKVVASMINSIFTPEVVHQTSELTPEEVADFVETLTAKQFQKLMDFIKGLPTIKHTVKMQCPVCKSKQAHTFKGIYDFFS